MITKDKLLLKLIKSWKFQRMTKQEQMVELQDYAFQKRNFKNGGINNGTIPEDN